MKNITFSADEDLIEAARQRARSGGTTLNEEFRRWLARYAAGRSVDGGPRVTEGRVTYEAAGGFTADAALIEDARTRAEALGTSLEAEFHVWLAGLAGRSRSVDDVIALIDELAEGFDTGGKKFSREEMNER